MNKILQLNAVSQRLRIFIQDSTTFQGKTGLAFGTAGLTFYYSLGPNDTAHAITLVTQTVGGAWSSGGFVEVDSVHEPGWYQFDIPNAVLVSGSGNGAQVVIKGTGILDAAIDIDLVDYNPFSVDKTGFALSNAAILALWSAGVAAMTVADTIGKLLADNVAVTKTNTDAIKTKTDALTLTGGKVSVDAHGLDSVIGYHPAGDA